MTMGLLFWILMLLWIIGFGWAYKAAPIPWPQVGLGVVPFILFLVLGWQVFGQPIK